MLDRYLFGGALASAAVVGAALVEPVKTGAAVGVFVVLWLLLSLPREKIGAFGLAVAATLAVAIPASEFSGSFRQALSVAAVAIMGLCYVRSSTRRPVHRAMWIVPIWLLILGIGEFSSSDAAVKWVVFSALVLMSVLLATRAEPRPVLRWLVVLALVQVAISALQVLTGLSLPWEQVTDISGNEILGQPWTRGPGTMGHPLPMVFLLITACVVLFRDRRWVGTASRTLALAALSSGFIFAGSRSGALIFLALALFASARRLLFTTWLLGGITSAIGLVLVAKSGFFASQAFETFMDSGSVYHRQEALDSFEKLLNQQGVKEVLLGRGYSGVPEAFDLGLLQSDGFNAVDNQFITLLATSGLIGAALFIALLWSAFRRGRSANRVLLVSLVLTFFIFDVLLWTSPTMLLMIVIGFALSERAEPVTASERPELDKVGAPVGR